jgi:hypothetical protein
MIEVEVDIISDGAHREVRDVGVEDAGVGGRGEGAGRG